MKIKSEVVYVLLSNERELFLVNGIVTIHL